MYGKFFASTFTGSMFGAGSTVFAVWGYVVATAQDGQVELNPPHLAALLGDTEAAVVAAIDYLCAPDPRSRTKTEDGRRLVREGEFAFRVPNHSAYRAIRNEDERREYNRDAKRKQRAKVPSSNGVKPPVIDTHGMSAQAEADTETKSRKAVRPATRGLIPNPNGRGMIEDAKVAATPVPVATAPAGPEPSPVVLRFMGRFYSHLPIAQRIESAGKMTVALLTAGVQQRGKVVKAKTVAALDDACLEVLENPPRDYSTAWTCVVAALAPQATPAPTARPLRTALATVLDGLGEDD